MNATARRAAVLIALETDPSAWIPAAGSKCPSENFSSHWNRLAQGLEPIEIDRPDDLGDLADLGLTLAEAKFLLASVQRETVAAQAGDHAVQCPETFRPPTLRRSRRGSGRSLK